MTGETTRDGGRPTVAVVGGGVGGLSAAHELAERGFEVTVYEAGDRPGGKARSVPGPEVAGETLPGEHGFRFFPGFYRHLPETMARIPSGGGTVADHLVPTTELLMTDREAGAFRMPTETPESLADWRGVLSRLFARDRVPRADTRHFVERLLTFLTSCEARREREYERTSWWEFIDADERSEAYQRNLAYGITQSLVAMRPEQSSARTVGRIYVQMLRGLLDPSVEADRLLDGPSNDVWIDPWVAYLRRLGVVVETGVRAARFRTDDRRVTGVDLADGDGERTASADYYVAAVPVEAMVGLVAASDGLAGAAPALARLDRLDTAWMAGVQFYLREDVPISHGHGVYYDSPWALTTVSQRQFWGSYDLLDAVGGVVSVCVSDWETTGEVYGKPARECTREEVIEEVWAQLQRHAAGAFELREENRLAAFLDPAIEETDRGLVNRTPLLVNTVDSLRHRPAADAGPANLVLAADYVHTHTDLASMEAANEAARRATNAVLDDAGSDARRCPVWNLREPGVFAPLKAKDRVEFRLGLPHPGEVSRRARRAADALPFPFGGSTP